MITNVVLDQVCHLVLEDWAMMMVDDTELSIAQFDAEQPFFIASVNYSGVFEGALTILAQRPFMLTLAQNVLGADASDAICNEQLRDAFSEMANVVSGNYLTAAYGKDVEFDLVLPRVEEIPAAIASVLLSKKGACYLADEHPIAICSEIHFAYT